MLGAMNADKHKRIFHAGRRHFVTVEAYVKLAREEVLDGKWPGKISQGQVIVEFDQQFRIRVGEEVLSGNFAGVNGPERHRGLITGRNHQLRRAADVALPDEQIEVAVGTHGWIGIGLRSERRSFCYQYRDSLPAEEL